MADHAGQSPHTEPLRRQVQIALDQISQLGVIPAQPIQRHPALADGDSLWSLKMEQQIDIDVTLQVLRQLLVLQRLAEPAQPCAFDSEPACPAGERTIEMQPAGKNFAIDLVIHFVGIAFPAKFAWPTGTPPSRKSSAVPLPVVRSVGGDRVPCRSAVAANRPARVCGSACKDSRCGAAPSGRCSCAFASKRYGAASVTWPDAVSGSVCHIASTRSTDNSPFCNRTLPARFVTDSPNSRT